MAKQWVLFAALTWTTLLANPAYSQPESDDFEPGFKGTARVFMGISSSKSLSQVSDENNKIDSLDQDANSETEFMVFPMFNLEYTLSNRATTLFAGKADVDVIQGDFLFKTGIRQKLPDNTVVSLSYIPNIGIIDDEVWKDPYLTGVKRSKTDRDSMAVALEVESLFGTPVYLNYTFASQEIDDEASGQSLLAAGAITAEEVTRLSRDSDAHIVESGFQIPLGGPFMMEAGIVYARNDAVGDAMSFDNYGADLSLLFRQPAFMVMASTSFNYADFDETHPVFDTRRQDNTYSANIGIEIPSPMGFDTMSLMIMADYGTRCSNITFYDNEEYSLGAGITYRF